MAPHLTPPIDKSLTVSRLVAAIMNGDEALQDVVEYLEFAGIANWGPELQEIRRPACRAPEEANDKSRKFAEKVFCEDISRRVSIMNKILSVLCEHYVAEQCACLLNREELVCNISTSNV